MAAVNEDEVVQPAEVPPVNARALADRVLGAEHVRPRVQPLGLPEGIENLRGIHAPTDRPTGRGAGRHPSIPKGPPSEPRDTNRGFMPRPLRGSCEPNGRRLTRAFVRPEHFDQERPWKRRFGGQPLETHPAGAGQL